MNNFSRNKVIFDSKTNNRGTIVHPNYFNNTLHIAIDTENSVIENSNNESERITYATQIMEFGITKGNKFVEIEKETRKMTVFTHPLQFCHWLHNHEYNNIIFYVFNAEYDVNALLPYLINEFGLSHNPKLFEPSPEYEGLYIDTSIKKMKKNEYQYNKISKDGKIYGLDINLQNRTYGTKVSPLQIKFIDMAKKVVGTLAESVEAFTNIQMNKDDLDYSIFRDYGHIGYTDNELLYLWNDVYGLSELVIEYIFSEKYNHSEKITTSSMALANYKDCLADSIMNATPNDNIWNIANNYLNHCNTKIEFLLKNADNPKYSKKLKDLEKLGNEGFINKYYNNPKEIFNYIFPVLNYKDFEFIKPSYNGGITRENTPVTKPYKNKNNWIVKNGLGVDINSSYPTSYTYGILPYGYGKSIEPEEMNINDKSKIYFLSFSCSGFKFNKGIEPNISKGMLHYEGGNNSKTYKNLNTWISDFSGLCAISVNSVDFEYLLNNAKIYDMEITTVLEYEAVQGLFNTFTEKFYGMKSNKKLPSSIRTWVKLILNGVYGKFGQNTVDTMKEDIYNSESNNIEEVIIKDENSENVEIVSEGIYLPVASIVTSRSRLLLLEMLNRINNIKGLEWAYCDTDSAYILGNYKIALEKLSDLIDVNNTGKLGLWKIEKYFSKINIIGIKKYVYYGAEELTDTFAFHCTLSGINRKYFKHIEKYLEKDDTFICLTPECSLDFVKKVNNGDLQYYVNKEDKIPVIYYDDKFTKIVKGVYQSIRKVNAINGTILKQSLYTIKGGISKNGK